MSIYAQALPSGVIEAYGSRIAPAGWLNCDGSAVSRATYASLFNAIVPNLGAATFTNATPTVVTNTAHGLSTGDSVFYTNSGGAMPTGLTANTLYYVVRVDANTYNLSSSRANAYAGTKLATTSTGSGTTTAWDCPNGLGDGSTTFTLPDIRGRTIAGMDTTGGTAAGNLSLAQTQGVYGNLGSSGGEQGHQIVTAELASHSHSANVGTNATLGTVRFAGDSGVNAGSVSTLGAGSDTAHNNVQPTYMGNYIIKV